MALHSTSERYNYIYGSNVTKLDGEGRYGDGTYGAQPKKKKNNRARRAAETRGTAGGSGKGGGDPAEQRKTSGF